MAQCQFSLDNYSHINCYSENTGSIDISFTDPNISFWWTGPNGFTSNSTNISSLYSGDYILTIVSLTVMAKYDKKNIFILPFSFMFIFGFGFFMSAFLFTSFPLKCVLWVSLDRVMFETSGLYVILVPLFYDFLKRKKFF